MTTAKQNSLPRALVLLLVSGAALVLMTVYLTLASVVQRIDRWRAERAQRRVRSGQRGKGRAPTYAARRHARRLPTGTHLSPGAY